MLDSMDPALLVAAAIPKAFSHADPVQVADARMFDGLMKGSTGALARSLLSPIADPSAPTFSELFDPSDSIASNYRIYDWMEQRMVFHANVNIMLAGASGVTSVFKQLLNRHD